MNDFHAQWKDVKEGVLGAVETVGASGWYILGSEVLAFEAALSKGWGTGAVVGCASGLDALEIGLRATGLKSGMKVLTSPLSAFASTLAIVRAGGVPVFVDVDDTGLLDLAKAEDLLRRNPDIRFLLPVHLFGRAQNMTQLGYLSSTYEITVVEDCCQAIGSSWDGVPVGAVGAASALSFYPTKNLGAFGDGGALGVKSTEVLALARALRDYGQEAKYVHSRIGMNSRLDELHAAVLRRALLPKLTDWNRRRGEIALRYQNGIASSVVRELPADSNSRSNWHLFPVLVEPSRRAAFRDHMTSSAVQTAIHYPTLIPHQGAMAECPFEVHGALDRALLIASSEVSLPIHPYLEDEDVDRVLRALNEWRG